MTAEKAKEYILQNYFDGDEDVTAASGDEEIEAMKCAVGALDKQIRKKPIPITRNEHANKIIGYGCPNCKKDIVGTGFYCWACGQRIDWSGV